MKEKFHILLTFMVFYLLIEMITFMWVDFGFLPSNIVVDLILAFAIGSVIFLIRSTKWSVIYISVIYSILIMLFLVNATMYSVYYDLFTLYQLQLIGEATDVFNLELFSFESLGIAIAITFLYAVYMRHIIKKYKGHTYRIRDYYPRALISFVSSLILVFTVFSVGTDRIEAFLEDADVTTFKRSSFEKYGIFGYYTKELEDILNQNDVDEVDPNDNVVIEYSEPTDYFGMFEGKNVINILMESVQSFAINETLTPNLFRLTRDGLYFPNSYSENKTNVSELISIIGNYPSVHFNPGVYDYDFSYSFPMLLKQEGYATTYLHDNVDTFYSRGALMPQLGFDNLYFHEDLYPGMEIWGWDGDYTPDSYTMQRMLPYISGTEQPFYSFWATMSSHGPYNYGQDNIELYEELGYFAAIDQAEEDGLWNNILAGADEEDVLRIRHYQATIMELDKAIGMLIDDLDDKGILDDTIIVMYGDHNVYYHNIHLKIFESTNNEYYNMEMYKNFFCIYNTDLSKQYLIKSGDNDTTIDDFVTPYNIVPTLLDLFGYEYDINMFLGSSIFDDKEDVFYSLKLTGFFNDNFYSADGTNLIYNKMPYTSQALVRFNANCAIIKSKLEYINDVYEQSRTERNTVLESELEITEQPLVTTTE